MAEICLGLIVLGLVKDADNLGRFLSCAAWIWEISPSIGQNKSVMEMKQTMKPIKLLVKPGMNRRIDRRLTLATVKNDPIVEVDDHRDHVSELERLLVDLTRRS